MQLPGIQEPGDGGPVPLLATDLDLQVVVVLVEPASIVLSNDIRLQHIRVCAS